MGGVLELSACSRTQNITVFNCVCVAMCGPSHHVQTLSASLPNGAGWKFKAAFSNFLLLPEVFGSTGSATPNH